MKLLRIFRRNCDKTADFRNKGSGANSMWVQTTASMSLSSIGKYCIPYLRQLHLHPPFNYVIVQTFVLSRSNPSFFSSAMAT